MVGRIMCMVDHLVMVVPFMLDNQVMVSLMVVLLAILGTCMGDLLDICKVDNMDQCIEDPMVTFKDPQEWQGVQA